MLSKSGVSLGNFYDNLPKKRMAVGVLLFFAGKILIVKPSYKDYWSVPGGIVEKDESLREACERETEEEIGLKVRIERLLCVDYLEERDGVDENLQFIFSGGELTELQVGKIKIDGNEIIDFRFLDPKDALLMLSERLKKRMGESLKALESGTSHYLENGENAI